MPAKTKSNQRARYTGERYTPKVTSETTSVTVAAGARVRVTMLEALPHRMHSCLVNSKYEEGGKLVGYIKAVQDPDGQRFVEIRIESYIDSGPNIDHSAVHIRPDGPYQEKVFRVLECWDALIDHGGSWHSHHTNGHPGLSHGDIDGYFETVNDPRYGPHFFVAYLVAGLTADSVIGECYLFVRGDDRYYRIPDGAITKIDRPSIFDEFLQDAEAISLVARSSRRPGRTVSPTQRVGDGEVNLGEQFLRSKHDLIAQFSELYAKRVRLEDKSWFGSHIPEAELLMNRRSGALGWKWIQSYRQKEYLVNYVYANRDYILLEVTDRNGSSVVQQQLPVTGERYEHLVSALDKLKWDGALLRDSRQCGL